MKFLVVGTGRCGTGYMSKVLTDAGLPCGHESIYTVNGLSKNPLLVGDSSWLAVPHLKNLSENIKVIHIVRDPLKVFRSWLFDQNNVISLEPKNIDSPFNRYIRKAFPSIDKQTTQVDKAAVYYLECNLNITKQCNELGLDYKLFRVEDDPAYIISWLGGRLSTSPAKWVSYNSRDTKIAGDTEVLQLLKQSKYYSELVNVFTQYYPTLYSRETLEV